MSIITSQELQQLARYKSLSQSTNLQRSQLSNIEQIKSIEEDLMKIIKLEENVFSLEFKRAFSRQRQRQSMSERVDRLYWTERNSPEKEEGNRRNKEDFERCLRDEWMSVVDYDRNNGEEQKRDSFFLDEQIETSEYVPMHYERNQNPEHFETQKVTNHQQFTKNDHNFVKKQSQTKTKAMLIKSPKNAAKNNTKTPATPKPPQKLLKTPPSTPKMQRKISQTLISPVKNFKKHILQAVEEKRQIEENELAVLMNKPKVELSKFYETNQTHVPVYEKSKLLQMKRQQDIQNYTLLKAESELDETTFRPVVNKKTEKMIEGRSFESRLEEYEVKREYNQQRIVYEVLQDFPFRPRLNPNGLVESRIKKIWQGQDKNGGQVEGGEIAEEDEDSEMDSEANRRENRDFFALVLEEKEAEEIFVD